MLKTVSKFEKLQRWCTTTTPPAQRISGRSGRTERLSPESHKLHILQPSKVAGFSLSIPLYSILFSIRKRNAVDKFQG
jgi:hypothetical protein